MGLLIDQEGGEPRIIEIPAPCTFETDRMPGGFKETFEFGKYGLVKHLAIFEDLPPLQIYPKPQAHGRAQKSKAEKFIKILRWFSFRVHLCWRGYEGFLGFLFTEPKTMESRWFQFCIVKQPNLIWGKVILR